MEPDQSVTWLSVNHCAALELRSKASKPGKTLIITADPLNATRDVRGAFAV